jgi:Mrp family chromosome partitioning ATPase
MVVAGDEREFVGEVASPTNPLVQVHTLLRGRYWIAIILAIVGAVAGGVVGYKIQQPTYTSTGMIRIKPYLPPLFDKDGQNGTLPFFESHLGSQVALLKSRRLIDHAMQQPDWKELNRGLEPEQVQEFIENLEASNPRGSEMLIVSFTDEQPDVARRAVKSVIDGYEQLYGENDNESVDSRVRKLEDIKTRLLTDQKATNERIRVLSGTMPFDSMNELYKSKLRDALKLKAQLRQLEAEIAGASPTTKPVYKPMTAEALAMRVPEMSNLLAERDALDRQIVVDQSRRGEKHQTVIEAKAQRKALNEQIEKKAELYNASIRENGEIAGDPDGKSPEQLAADFANLQKRYEREQAETDELGQKCLAIEKERTEATAQHSQLEETTERIQQLRNERQIADRIIFVSRGDMPLAPAKDKRKAFAAAGALGAAGAGVGLVLLFGFLDRRIRHISDVKTTGQCNRVLGVLPMLPTEGSDPEQAMVAAHGVHQIRMLLQGHMQANKKTVIAITSASPGAGKTSLTLALGLSFAASGARTLMIDCDIVGGGLTSKIKRTTRRRTGHVLRRLGLISSAQLVAAVRESRQRGERIGETLVRQGLVTRADVEHALQMQQESTVGLREALMGDPPNECITGAGTPGLFVMPLGSARRQHVAELSFPALQRLVNQARAWFDVILIDTGPILGSLEASVAAMVADEVVLAVAKGEQRPLIDRSIQHLDSVGGRLAGIVLNRASADDILASEFSSSSPSRVSGDREDQIAPAIRAVDHRCLQLGPIGRAVVAVSSAKSPEGPSNISWQPRQS